MIDIPNGFFQIPQSGAFADDVGPFYARESGPGRFDYGFVAEPRHENPNGVLHGGALNTFADHFLGHAVVHATKRMCATVSLNADYVTGAKAGRFIQGAAEVVRETRTMIFMRGTVYHGEEVYLSVNGVWRLFGPFQPPG